MKQQLLLLEDIEGLGRSGDIVTARPGFVRNFLLPQKKAVVAAMHTLKLRTRLQEERQKRAVVDRNEAESLAEVLKDLVITLKVKADQEGKMYGSITVLDLVKVLEEQGHIVERKSILLPHPLKNLGTHKIQLRLKEAVAASFTLCVESETAIPAPREPAE